MSIRVSWQQDLTFLATSGNGHQFTIDADSNTAPCPTEVLLSALGSCSATDVLLGLQEEGAKISALSNEISYELTDEEPRLYKSANLHFTLKGEGIDGHRVKKAADNALNKYCHVCLMLQPKIALSYSFKII